MKFPYYAAVPVLVLALALAGCSGAASDSSATPAAAASSSAPQLTGTITVLAAASLTDTFTELGTEFEQANPGVTVVVSFGGSSDLAAQITAGSPADVFASASPATMKTVTDASLAAAAPVNFVSNTLEIAVPTGNPAKITGISDFADKNLKIALCAVAVPCGAAAKTVFDSEKITAQPDTYEQDVKSVLTKVELGEVDAGMVYKTDVLAAGSKVEGIEFPEAKDAVNEYPIAALKNSKSPEAANAFVAFVLGAKGKAVLSAAGFATP